MMSANGRDHTDEQGGPAARANAHSRAADSLRREGERLRARELHRALRLLPDLTIEEVAVLEDLARSLTEAILRDPIGALLSADRDAVRSAAIAQILFCLPDEAADAF
ncbi:MAG: hypothetical protein O3B84_08155 [Chloroflexi bacterium]|nr:hypothetical protein [Chloroflexota bacterium]